MHRTTALIFLLLLFCITLQAQELTQTIRGKVVDSQSGSPLPGATVMVYSEAPNKGSVTDIDGIFEIREVPVGRHHLKVRFVGYEEKTIPEILVGSGKEVILTIKLTESLIQMDEVVVVASEENKGEPLNEMSYISAQSFSVEETSRYAATFDDPGRAMLSFAGVRGGGDDVLNEIVIRGNSPKGLLWRIEGMEVPNPNHFAEEGSSAGGISMLSSSMLSNSDFFTGAFPAEYGNALSGVFDIHLRQGNNQNREYAFQAGILGIQMAAEGPFSKNSRGSYLLNYRYSTLALFDNIGVNLTGENETITFQDLAFKFHVPMGSKHAVSLWGLGGISEQLFYADPDIGDLFNSTYKTTMGAAGISHIFYPDENTYLESKIGVMQTLNNYHDDSLGLVRYYDEEFEHEYIRASTTLNRKFNARHTVRGGLILNRIGYDVYSNFLEFGTSNYINDADARGHTWSMQGFTQWQYRISNRLTLNSGLHYIRLLLNDNDNIEPRAGLKWQFHPNQSLSAGFGMHSRMESTSIYLAQEELPDGSFVQPNRDLEFTKSTHYVLGYENMIKPGLRFRAEAYYQDLYDVPIRPVTAAQPWERVFSALNISSGFTSDTLVNEGTGENYGIELTLEKYLSKNYYYMITGSVYESRYTAADGLKRNTRFNGNFLTNVLAGKEFQVGRKGNNLLGINARMIWSGGNRIIPIDLEQSINEGQQVRVYDRAYSERLPNYWRLDLGIRYRKNKPKHSSIIALNIQNVTARLNAFDRYFSSYSNRIITEEQLGILPNLSYRLEF